jgi:TatD DNase family protein
MLIDTHAHLDDQRFSEDLSDVLHRAEAAGIERILTIGIDVATSRAAIQLAERHPLVRGVVGIQPNSLGEIKPGDWEAILKLAEHPAVVGIGETGLDRYWDRAPLPLQEEYFARHLELCRRLARPVVIHCREAESDVVRMLRSEFDRFGPIRGVMHSFTGDAATVRACLDAGLHISFAGMVTFKNNQALRDVAATVPLDRLLVETDSPYLAPMPHRGKRNEPAFVKHTAECLAGVLAIPFDDLAAQTTRSARVLFGLTS